MTGAADVEVAQQVLAETQSAILPLVPYLDTLRWVFIAVALGGIKVSCAMKIRIAGALTKPVITDFET